MRRLSSQLTSCSEERHGRPDLARLAGNSWRVRDHSARCARAVSALTSHARIDRLSAVQRRERIACMTAASTSGRSVVALIDKMLQVVERETRARRMVRPIRREPIAVGEAAMIDQRLASEARRLLMHLLIDAVGHERLRAMRRGRDDARGAVDVLQRTCC